jgi:hypothetical protein
MGTRIAWGTLGLIGILFTGCAPSVVQRVNAGEYGSARAELQRTKNDNKGDRNYILDRMRVNLVTIADGYALSSDPAMDDLFKLLRTHDVNQGSEVKETVLFEGVKIWKGEPFEQAMAFHYVGTHYGMQGDWGNTRASEIGSLFQLKDFGVSKKGFEGTQELLAKAQKADKASNADADHQYLDHGYVARDTDFALGYLMAALANQQLAVTTGDSARANEAEDYFNKTVAVKNNLSDLASDLRRGDYNYVFVVDWGQGPLKYGTGPDNSVADFKPVTPSDDSRLVVSVDGQQHAYPLVCDLNLMSVDHRWRNLEDVRKAKSYIGDALLIGGAATGAYGAINNNSTAGYVGLGLAVAGLIVKASAAADLRYCEIMPQRVYVVPAKVTSTDSKVQLQIENKPLSTLLITGLAPPSQKGVSLRYVRLVSATPAQGQPAAAPGWATSGRLFYASDGTPDAGAVKLPYILGGTCCRTPSEEALKEYQHAGFLQGMTLSQLQDLYKAEKIALTPQDQSGSLGSHVLEGGDSLVAPLPGTAGFVRLFGQQHPPYQPKSDQVKALAQQLQQQIHNVKPQVVASR